MKITNLRLSVCLPVLVALGGLHFGCRARPTEPTRQHAEGAQVMSCPLEKTEEAWRDQLTPEQYRVLREKGTERAGSGRYYRHKAEGRYACAACGQVLFDSDAKYESGSGWPSFWRPAADENVKEVSDHSHGMVRTEVLCSACQSHLGHVFSDGPDPTGLRYCINSLSLQFLPASTSDKGAADSSDGS